ncbi:MAG: 4-fold beta flower protein [Planctomycetota bacterium]
MTSLDDMQPVYGRCGTVLAWIQDEVLYDMCGRWVAFFDDGAVYSFRGKLLGFYEDGWFRDQRGDAVGFTLDHADDGGPVPPVCEPAPLPPALDFPPIPATPHHFPVSPIAGVDWSIASWNEFVAGTGAACAMF